MPDFLPQKLQSLAAWAMNFTQLLHEAPQRYGSNPEVAASLRQLAESFDESVHQAMNPDSRTPVSIVSRDIARAALLQLLRPVAAQIRVNYGVDPSDKVALGLAPDRRSPSPCPRPLSAPVLSVVEAKVLQHTLRYHDQNTPTRRAKPLFVSGMQLVRVVGEMPADGPRSAQLVGVITRQPFAISFVPEQAGQRAFYWGRWQTASGKTGPWSAPASMLIAA